MDCLKYYQLDGLVHLFKYVQQIKTYCFAFAAKVEFSHRISSIIQKEFSTELTSREKDVLEIEDRLHQALKWLHTVRYVIVSAFYNKKEVQVSNGNPHCTCYFRLHSYQHSFIPLACAECDDSLLFSGASSVPLCYVLFLPTLLHQLFIHPLSPHLAIYFLVYRSVLLFQNSYIILFWEFYFLPISIHAQTNVIYITLLSLL